MRAVVTGGAGFLGSHLCDRLIAEGWDVLALDNLITGVDSNVSHLMKHPKFRVARGDVSNYIDVAGARGYVAAFFSPSTPAGPPPISLPPPQGPAPGPPHTMCPAPPTNATVS